MRYLVDQHVDSKEKKDLHENPPSFVLSKRILMERLKVLQCCDVSLYRAKGPVVQSTNQTSTCKHE